MDHSRTNATLVALAIVGSLAGCGGESTPIAAPKPAAPRIRVDYPLTGEVKDVKPAEGVVTIRHDAIQGFMDAMTMPFRPKDRSLLEDLRPGDEVEGTLQVEREGNEVVSYDLTRLVVSRPAPAQAFTLDLSKSGEVRLEPARKQLEPGQEVPDFAMTTQDGKTIRLSDLRGKVVALTFIYTRCPLPDFCPLMDKKFGELASLIAAVPERIENIRLLSISFDPEHDTPRVLSEHARMRGARGPLWTFAVASHPELAKVSRPLGLTYGPTEKEIIHNLSTAVIDPEGRLVRLETGAEGKSWRPSDLATSMYARLPVRKR